MHKEEDRQQFNAATMAWVEKLPFAHKPFFKPGEFDEIAWGALAEADCLPTSPGPIGIELFIEKKFGITPEFSALPQGAMGGTLFNEQGVVGVVVSKALDRRRQNSTLAHEAGHMLLHTRFMIDALQALGATQPLIPARADSERTLALCNDDPRLERSQLAKPQFNLID